jgi:hypothetical protein
MFVSVYPATEGESAYALNLPGPRRWLLYDQQVLTYIPVVSSYSPILLLARALYGSGGAGVTDPMTTHKLVSVA